MMHSDYTLLMSLKLDGEASDGDEQRLREHLRSCAACALTWQQWRELDRRFKLTPAITAPLDFAAVVAAQLDGRVAGERRRRWFIAWLAAAWVAAVVVALISLALVNGWVAQLAPASGPLVAAWSGIASTGGWLAREIVAALTQIGAPAVAAATGVVLCLTCALAMTWLWVVARVGPGPQAWVTVD